MRRLEPRKPWLGHLPMQIPRKRWKPIAFTLFNRRQHDLLLRRIQIEPLLRSEARHVRQAKTDGNEEGFAGRQRFQLGDGGVGDFPIRLVVVIFRKYAPVYQPNVPRRVHELLRRQRHSGRRAPDVELFGVQAWRNGAVVKHLAETGSEVALSRKMLRQGNAGTGRGDRADAGCQAVNPGGGRPQAGQQAGA